MGVCDSNNNKLYNINYSSFSGIQHVQTFGDPEKKSYKFNFSDKNSIINRKFNLKFIFYNFKIKYCISHKQSKDSFYITQISIGEKVFPLIINQGQLPSIPNHEDIQNGYFHQKEYTLDELENTYLLINIYEYLEDTEPLINESLKSFPDEYKNKCKYNSFFRINLLSFLFKSQKCDFAMMGESPEKQLSTKTRISFYCFIEHRERIIITAKALKEPNIYSKIVCKSNNINFTAEKNKQDEYSIVTPPMTMNEFQKTDIFLETNENYDIYEYISLNGLKSKIINRLGFNLINQENNFSNMIRYKPVYINNDEISINSLKRGYYKFGNQEQYNQLINQNQDANDKAYLFCRNLPIIGQIPTLYFTEFGNIYNTAILNLINDDPGLRQYRENKQISCEDFYKKLYNYFTQLTNQNFDLSILNEIHVLLMRSIDTERFMFIYPTYEDLNKMICLFLDVGIKIIEIILNTEEDYKIIILTKLINILMRREELDNAVLCECMDQVNSQENIIEYKYSKLNNGLYNLYELLLSNKFAVNNDTSLIELFSRLYFQKKYFRLLLLSTFKEEEYKYSLPRQFSQNDVFLYDIINNERLNEHLNNPKKGFKNFVNDEENLKKKNFDNYRLIKRIIAIINDSNLNQYPFDFILFSDSEIILELMQKDLDLYKKEQFTLTNDFYEAVMLLSHSYFSISQINKKIIISTNGHNPNAVYTLFIYFKSLFDYYYSATNNRLIMSYTTFEEATRLLAENEDSLSLPRLFWFYYCCSHMMLTGNLKWFIVNIINKNFEKFAFHWSFTIRQVFFKLAIFILYERLKNEEGKLFRKEKLNDFFNKNMENSKDPYIFESNKDFAIIEKEYNDWNERRKENEDADYPMFFLPAPISNYGVMDQSYIN